MKQWEEKEVEIGKQTKLSYQKKEGFLRGGGTKNEILAEAGDQPRQKQ